MYEVNSDSIQTFITSNIRLPRFQRKQTWGAKQNFQLCISLFKNYPIGVCIVTSELVNGRSVRYLLDGRQRRNALKLLAEDPELIYVWAQKFIKFKSSDQPYEVREKFYSEISKFLEEDPDSASPGDASLSSDEDQDAPSTETPSVDSDVAEDSENTPSTTSPSDDLSSEGLELLLKIILCVHKKTARWSQFTVPFDFSKWVDLLPYVERTEGSYTLSSKELKRFIDDYKVFCVDRFDGEYKNKENFLAFIKKKYRIINENKLKEKITQNWPFIVERIDLLQSIDDRLATNKIGIIEVKNMSSFDYQKIFNLINSEGEKLKAVEILSAKPKWNIPLEHPSQQLEDAARQLYRRIGVVPENYVKWDLPATFLYRLGPNYFFHPFSLSESPTEFVKELTTNFVILSGILVKDVKKEAFDALGADSNINWDTDIDSILSNSKTLIGVLNSHNYFRYLASWRFNWMDLTSDYVAMNFFIVTYLNWLSKGRPVGTDSKAKAFQKESFILIDRLVYEYLDGVWKSSADARIKNNIAHLEDNFEPITTEKWLELLNEIFNESRINGNDITFKQMKPLLLHFYCLSSIDGPSVAIHNELDFDHIIPQNFFDNCSTIERASIIKDNILNLGILTKENNTSKSNKKLTDMLSQPQWKKDEIKKYEFIEEADYLKYSQVENYLDMYNMRKVFFEAAFKEKRNALLNMF